MATHKKALRFVTIRELYIETTMCYYYYTLSRMAKMLARTRDIKTITIYY